MTRDEHRSADYLIDWRSWRGPKQSGWYELSAPRWWPRGERARFPLLLVTALAVKARFALFPPKPAVTEDEVDAAELEALLEGLPGSLPLELAPDGQRAGAMSVGFAVDPTPNSHPRSDSSQNAASEFARTTGATGSPFTPSTRWPGNRPSAGSRRSKVLSDAGSRHMSASCTRPRSATAATSPARGGATCPMRVSTSRGGAPIVSPTGRSTTSTRTTTASASSKASSPSRNAASSMTSCATTSRSAMTTPASSRASGPASGA